MYALGLGRENQSRNFAQYIFVVNHTTTTTPCIYSCYDMHMLWLRSHTRYQEGEVLGDNRGSRNRARHFRLEILNKLGCICRIFVKTAYIVHGEP